MRKPSRWKHPSRYNQIIFKGNYERDKDNKRKLVLTQQNKNPARYCLFESHEEAKKAGWEKVG